MERQTDTCSGLRRREAISDSERKLEAASVNTLSCSTWTQRRLLIPPNTPTVCTRGAEGQTGHPVRKTLAVSAAPENTSDVDGESNGDKATTEEVYNWSNRADHPPPRILRAGHSHEMKKPSLANPNDAIAVVHSPPADNDKYCVMPLLVLTTTFVLLFWSQQPANKHRHRGLTIFTLRLYARR